MENIVRAYCIFIDTLLQGEVSSVSDDNGQPYIFTTRNEAEREIAENAIARLEEFLNGARDFDDAMTISEFVVEVEVLSDGTIIRNRQVVA